MSLPAPVSSALRLTFTAPPPGLAPLVEFELAPVPGGVGLYTLRDTVGADLRLFLVDPRFYVPEYTPGIPAEQLGPLGAESPADLEVYVVATLASEAPVVNLLAPILVNTAAATAAQVILEEDWPLQAELIAA